MSTGRMDLSAERMEFISAMVEQCGIGGAAGGLGNCRMRLRTSLTLLHEGEYAKAIAEASQIVRETHSVAAHLVLVEGYVREKQYDLALLTLDVLLLADPHCAEAILMKGLIHREQGDWSRARALLHRAARLNPELLLAWKSLIDMALEEDNTHEAARLFGEALRYHPAHCDLTGTQAWLATAAV